MNVYTKRQIEFYAITQSTLCSDYDESDSSVKDNKRNITEERNNLEKISVNQVDDYMDGIVEKITTEKHLKNTSLGMVELTDTLTEFDPDYNPNVSTQLTT